MKVAIVGCGKISDEHAWVIQTIPGAQIVAVCDREELMARQMAERFGVPGYFVDAHEMLERAKPDVVHITTSPQSHFELGRACLQSGRSVFIEKPFTVTADEAQTLVDIAEQTGAKLTAGHDNQFSPVAVEMRKLVQSGFLGGEPVHVESLFPYDMSDERYARALLANRTHWVRKLPGKLAHNVISHGIAKIAEFLVDEDPGVTAIGFRSPILERVGEREIFDELRVLIRDSTNRTAYFTFSSQISPGLHQMRLHGPKRSLLVDYTHQILVPIEKRAYKSYLNQFIPPFLYGKAVIKNGLRNIGRFLKNDFHQDSGRRYLVGQFYASIREGAPLPIPYAEIIRTARIMDEIFAQVAAGYASDTYVKQAAAPVSAEVMA
jgi:predicted dehydrogenase